MQDSLTPAAGRTVASCRRMTGGATAPQLWCDFLMLALLQDESLAAAAMRRLGISVETLLASRHSLQALEDATAHLRSNAAVTSDIGLSHGTPTVELDDPPAFVRILDRAALLARSEPNSTGISSAHLLVAVYDTNELLREQMSVDGVDRDRIVSELNLETNTTGPSLPVDFDITWTMSRVRVARQCNNATASGKEVVWRVLDANLNRSREGLRVLEDYARFVRNDANLSERLKELRHELVGTESLLLELKTRRHHSDFVEAIAPELLLSRDTGNDVGTRISANAETIRNDMSDVVIANSRRVQEALRSLEEFGKLLAPEFAANIKQLRYRSYVLQQELSCVVRAAGTPNLHAFRVRKLRDAVLYVLITESVCRLPWQRVVEAAVRGGADVLQLREKNLNDRELLFRARWMADACRDANRLFIVNDRADLAVAANADGLHVGQDEIRAADARAVLRPDQILGISTHTIQQAQVAQSDGADYIGVGPTFPTNTKSFSEFPGLALLKNMSHRLQIPAFAIGGIGLSNIEVVQQAGGIRVAVTSSVAGSEDPEAVVRELKYRLEVKTG